ncbi:MAG: LCP family protein [Anaerolineaceae bacterium]|nr:LCP family protein [Anaerolineaceae bacterium]
MAKPKKQDSSYRRLRLSTEDQRNLEITRPNLSMAHHVDSQHSKQAGDEKQLSLEGWQNEALQTSQDGAKTRRSDSIRERRRRKRATRRVTPFKVFFTAFVLLFIALFGVIYFLFPQNSTILILGLDRSLEEDTWYSRSDTIIISQLKMVSGEVAMLSIPRDLWVTIPGYGENRINTAHYFAEVNNPGTGPQAAIQTIEANFGVTIDHYVRLKLEEFPRLIDAMGGITLELDEAMGGLEAGTHKLDGTEALVFVRDRVGTDDFFRMKQGQVFLKAVIDRLKEPGAWVRFPLILGTAQSLVDTDIPVWQWPRLMMVLMRGIPDQFTSETLGRDMVNPYITAGGANVLLPNWEMIWALSGKLFH